MLKEILFNGLEKYSNFLKVNEYIEKNISPLDIYGLNQGEKYHFMSYIKDKFNKQTFIITYNKDKANELYENLKTYGNESEITLFSHEEIFHYTIDAKNNKPFEKKIEAINDIILGDKKIIISSIECLQVRMPDLNRFKRAIKTLKLGDIISLDDIIKEFLELGYKRVSMVEDKGELALRGGILDIFPLGKEKPIRIELFDDEIDSIRSFSPETQKSIDKLEKVRISPATNMLFSKEEIENGLKIIEKDYNELREKIDEEYKNNLDEKYYQIVNEIKENKNYTKLVNYIPYFTKNNHSILDYIDDDSIIILDEVLRIKDRASSDFLEFSDNFNTILEKGHGLKREGLLLNEFDFLIEKINQYNVMNLSLLPRIFSGLKPKENIQFTTREVENFNGKFSSFLNELKRLEKASYKIILIPGSKERAIKLLEYLRGKGISVDYLVKAQDLVKSNSNVIILNGSIKKGFEYIDEKIVLITDYELYGIQRREKKAKGKKKAFKSYNDLKIGDYVVHENHGIGKYLGIEKLETLGVSKDYIKIKYSGKDQLYIPTEQMDLVEKYIGDDNSSPKLSRLGGKDWVKSKKKAEEAAEKIAEDLVKLYAKRKEAKGFKFSEDKEWQREFEELFPYEETNDQLKSIKEVKKDMESFKPMDRLLCGDVGYGKTEVAIRAAFKAILDGKQVAFLVPTTILAQQHYNNFKSRFEKFPTNVEMLSRFRTAKRQKEIIEAVKVGNIDIIIGTHRILSKDLKFKDLGLLIIDEEQRFGVKHKEILKELKNQIDVLTLTATPIPRTLHMSMIGIRDISLIEEPPEERYPIETYVMPENKGVISDAIIREISRGGQVYYVYNSVENIELESSKINRLVPEARIKVAHGQMSERELEKIMLEFYSKEIDILVCTTIIETGMDFQNVNTMIIKDADKLGLSQLYQLRGRVGRSNRQGYAYLMYERDKVLSEVADKRLKAIKEFTEFGSGFKIAMRDLEIRGAGNLLGKKQHGHIGSIGYELYVKILSKALDKVKGKKEEESINVSFEVGIDGFIPSNYIKEESEKIEIYKKIVAIESEKDMFSIEEEIEDRFGDVPMVTRNLINISLLKALGKKIYVDSFKQIKDKIIINFSKPDKLKPEALSALLEKYRWKVSFHSDKGFYLKYNKEGKEDMKILNEIKGILEYIIEFNK